MRKLFLLLCVLLGVLDLKAQSTSTPPPLDVANTELVNAFLMTSNANPRLGEVFELTLIVEAPSNVEIVELPSFPNEADEGTATPAFEIQALEILEIGEVEQVTSSENISYRQTFQAVLWQVGDYLSPELFVSYRVNGGDLRGALVRSVSMTVSRTIVEPLLTTPQPDLPQIYLAYFPRWIFGAICGGFFVLVLLAFVILRLGGVRILRILRGTPALRAIAQLEDLLRQKVSPDIAYPLIAAALREYLLVVHQVNAGEMTTGELMDLLYEKDIFDKQQFQRLRDLLEQTDLVKFAQFNPSKEEYQGLVEQSMQWLRDDERIEERKKREKGK